jgi:hypothetical protein
LGITDQDEINRHLYFAHRGHLADYLKTQGKEIKFGMLRALFLDAQTAKKRTDLKVGIVKLYGRYHLFDSYSIGITEYLVLL